MIRYILFDLDETLYPTTNGLMQAIGDRMRDFIEHKYHLSSDDAQSLRERYWDEYGTTLRGLYIEHQIDPREYLDYVHDIDLAPFIQPDPQLRHVLMEIPQEKVIVTNADSVHANRILRSLGIADQFTRIFDIVSMQYECKPSPIVYQRVLDELNAPGPECVLVEDMARNLPAARAKLIKTILVNATDCTPDADVCIENIYQVAQALLSISGAMVA